MASTGRPVVFTATKGLKAFDKEVTRLMTSVDKATVAGIRANQRVLKAAVKKKLSDNGPRWNQRGKSRIYENNFKINNMMHNEPRSGPPGRFSGAMVSGVGSVRRIKNKGGMWTGGVGVGGNVNNLKKHTLERKFPYFAPTVAEVERTMDERYAAAWAKAINKSGGFF